MRSRCTIFILSALVPLSFGRNLTIFDDFEVRINDDFEYFEESLDYDFEGRINDDDIEDFDAKIIGGTFGQISHFPSTVAIRIKDFGLWCGGVLISSRWVVSAAQCFAGVNVQKSGYLVRAGSNFHYKGGAISNIEKIIIHPNYDPMTFDYDIAMVKLIHGFPKKIRQKYPIGFIKPSQKKQPVRWSRVWVTGWGANRQAGKPVRKLHRVNLRIVPRRYCNTKTNLAGLVTKRMLCAGRLKGGKDACQGDIGGPMYQNRKLVGITSWGLGCANPNSPGVWTNVAYFVQWMFRIRKTE